MSLTNMYESDSTPDTTDTSAGNDLPLIPDHPSYLVGGNNHEMGGNGSSIFDPTTWGDRADKAYMFTVSTLTRAVASAWNSAVTVGEMAGLADDSNKADTKEWLQGMDDDLSQYYSQNKQTIDTMGDVVGMFVPGMAGMKVLNWTQKGIKLATEGRAGLSMAAHFGTLPTYQAKFAAQAAKEMSQGTAPFNFINANLAKSLSAGYAQSALELAAFDTAASITMGNDSPLFKDHDAGDIAYNALLGGGFIGAGLIGSVTAARTIMDIKAAQRGIDKAMKPYTTVANEIAEGTGASEAVALHLGNIEALPTVQAGEDLATLKLRNVNETKLAELDNGRKAMQKLASGDNELGNISFDVMAKTSAEEVAQKMAGVVRTARSGITNSGLETLKKQDNIDVQHLIMFGPDAGNIVTKPATLRMADTYASESEVLAVAKSFQHKIGQDWDAALETRGADAIESRYITAQELDKFDLTKQIAPKDIPFLERAYAELAQTPAIATITLKDGTVLDRTGLFSYLKDLKLDTAQRMRDMDLLAPGENPLTNEDIAKAVNISPAILRGIKKVDDTDFLYFQSAGVAHDAALVDKGIRFANSAPTKMYLQPQSVALYYDLDKASNITDHEISGMAALKEQQVIYQQQAKNVFDTYLASKDIDPTLYSEINRQVIRSASREGIGQGLFTSANADYLTMGSEAQSIGVKTNKVRLSNHDALAHIFNSPGSKLLTDTAAGTEFWKVVQQLRQTPEKYTWVAERRGGSGLPVGGSLVNIKQLAYEQKVAEAQAAGEDVTKIAKPVFEDTRAPVEIPLRTEGMNEFANTWDNYRRGFNSNRQALRSSQGLQVQKNLADTFYIPPVDSRDFPHFAFVVDDSLSGTGHVSMIHANTAADLEALAAKVPQQFRVIYKEQSERWHQAMKDYDYDLGINENYIDTALKRTGAAAPFQPVTDPKVLFEQLIKWSKNQEDGLLRDMVSHRYSTEFAELERQGKLHELAQTSTKGYLGKWGSKEANNPYRDYIRTMLDISPEGKAPIWSAINRLAETGISSAVSRLEDTFKKAATPEDLERVNAELTKIGCNPFMDAGAMALANHTAPKPVLSNFVRKANALLSFTMLRSDPLNAVNNGFGHAVLYGAELPRMIKDIYARGGDAAAQIDTLAKVKVPGTPSSIMSPTKLAARAYQDWFKVVLGENEQGELFQYYKANNWLPSYTDQFRTMMDSLTLVGNETPPQINAMTQKAFDAAKAMEKYSGNKFAEEMNRFVAARTAHLVAEQALKQGVITKDMVPSIINTFVNRTQGVHLASQRPLLFKGAVGQAVGLFQTYQFNMLQQLFRYVGDRNVKSAATLLGLQGAVYGMNGLPAFNAINTYLVGGTYRDEMGNLSARDITSTVYSATDREVGDWLMYGASSNFLLHPDAKVNLYSRGDINPRQVTVVPTSLADVPVVGATSKFFGSMFEAFQKMDKGADKWQTFLQGVEHSGVSRPLAGIAQVLEATANPGMKVISTDNAGNMIAENDLFSAMSAARILGAKPLDEAYSMDAYYRVQVYASKRLKELNNLGEGIKATVAGGNVPSSEQVNDFLGEYVKAGGNQQQFAKWYNQQVLRANRSKVNQMVANTNTFQGRYYQKLLGGYELQDNINSGGL